MLDPADLTALYNAALAVQDAVSELTDRLEAVLPEPDAEPEKLTEPLKRLTLDIPERLHTRIKLACVANRQKMTEAIRSLLEEHWPEAA
jgi:hypothetical protein